MAPPIENTASLGATSVDPATFNITISTSSDRLLIVVVNHRHNDFIDIVDIKIGGSGGTSLTQLGTELINGSVEASVWYAVDADLPGSGTQEIWVDFDNSVNVAIAAIELSGVNQSTPFRSNSSATGTGTDPGLTGLTSDADDIVVASCSIEGDSITGVDTGQTEQEAPAANPGSNVSGEISQSLTTESGAATVDSGWTANNTFDDWVVFAMSVQPASGGGVSQTVGLATETDTAFAVTAAKSQTVGLPLETDTAFSLSSAASVLVGIATEADTAFPVTATKSQAVGLASETETALAVTHARSQTVGLASETDTAFAVTAAKIATVGLASEVDSALAATAVKSQTVGLATEAESAFAVTHARAQTVGLAIEIDTALRLPSEPEAALGNYLLPWRRRRRGD